MEKKNYLICQLLYAEYLSKLYKELRYIVYTTLCRSNIMWFDKTLCGLWKNNNIKFKVYLISIFKNIVKT